MTDAPLFEPRRYSNPHLSLPLEANPNFDPETGWFFRRAADAKRDDTYRTLARCLGDPETDSARGCLSDKFEYWGCVPWKNDESWAPTYETHPDTGLPNLVLTRADGQRLEAVASIFFYGEEAVFILPDCWYAVDSPFTGFEAYQALYDG